MSLIRCLDKKTDLFKHHPSKVILKMTLLGFFKEKIIIFGEFIMLKMLTYCALAILSMNISTLAMDVSTPAGDVEPSKVKVTLHIINKSFGPGTDGLSNYFDQCQQLAEQELPKSGFRFDKDQAFTVSRYAEEHKNLIPATDMFGRYYHYDRPLSVNFSVEVEGKDTISTKGVKKPYDIKASRGQFIDVSIPLSLEEWKNTSRYRVDLLGHSYRSAYGPTSCAEKCLDSISQHFSSFYVSRSGDTTEYHLFHDIEFTPECSILGLVTDSTFLYEEFNEQNSGSLKYEYLTEKKQ